MSLPTDSPDSPESEYVVANEPKRRFLLWIASATLAAMLLSVAAIGWWLTTAPNYSGEREVLVTPGQSVSEVVATVAGVGVVRSELLLYGVTQLSYRDETIETGTYTFSNSQNVFSVARELMLVTPADELVAVTFPEGITLATMASIAAAALTEVSKTDFLTATEGMEGELLPETYFVPVDFTTEELIALLTRSQDELLLKNNEALTRSGLSEYQVLILASILEREANDERSMRAVAGILLNRFNAGMPLQADATIEYVLETPLNELQPGELAENLRELESPYNTYLNAGLPPTPIGNPGQLAIEAVLNPIQSNYFFYITGADGEFYYAETYEQHLVNIERHLR